METKKQKNLKACIDAHRDEPCKTMVADHTE